MRYLWVLLLLSTGCAPRTDGSMRESPSPAHAREFTAAEPLGGRGDTATAELFLPRGTDSIHGVLIFINRGLDEYAYDNREWRAMCARASCALLRLTLPRQDGPPASQLVRDARLGGGEALLALLRRLAQESGRTELAEAGLILWGFSAAGNFGPTFAQWQPSRTIGFVRYHSNMRGIATDLPSMANTPALIVAGERDDVAGVEDSERFWTAGREHGAPWAFVVHPGQPHWSVDGLLEASPLMRSWIEGLFLQHARTSSSGAEITHRPYSEEMGWVGNHATGELIPAHEFRGERRGTSWLPDERSALAWHALRGPCAAVPLSVAAEGLGPTAQQVGAGNAFCQYTAAGAVGDTARLVLAVRGLSTVGEAQQVFHTMAERAGGAPRPHLADDAFAVTSADRGCSVVALRRENYVYEVSVCRPATETTERTPVLERLARRLAGQPVQ